MILIKLVKYLMMLERHQYKLLGRPFIENDHVVILNQYV